MPFYFEHKACTDATSRNFQELAEHMKDCETDDPEYGVLFVDQATAQRLRREAEAAASRR